MDNTEKRLEKMELMMGKKKVIPIIKKNYFCNLIQLILSEKCVHVVNQINLLMSSGGAGPVVDNDRFDLYRYNIPIKNMADFMVLESSIQDSQIEQAKFVSIFDGFVIDE